MRRPSNDELKKWYGIAKATIPKADEHADQKPPAHPVRRAERKRFRSKKPDRTQAQAQHVADQPDRQNHKKKQISMSQRGSGLLETSATEEFKPESTLIPRRD
ncbi:hypothetical protein MAE02_37590 [Microvirga aerophila]|uniref:Uncharacterized protein n=1 Tax=Microvirga aerophila TaxID=670291 RepID=A0A512BVU4_9HYPH|nr:hypothetical protein MAE02_37590 [Microvirga aerophila]